SMRPNATPNGPSRRRANGGGSPTRLARLPTGPMPSPPTSRWLMPRDRLNRGASWPLWGAAACRRRWPKPRRRCDRATGPVALAFATVAAYYLVFVLGWVRILGGLGIRVSYTASLQAEMISMLAKYVPGGIWTPAARVAAFERLTGQKARGTVLASILVEAV